MSKDQTTATAWNCPYWKCREDGVCHGVTYGGCRDETVHLNKAQQRIMDAALRRSVRIIDNG